MHSVFVTRGSGIVLGLSLLATGPAAAQAAPDTAAALAGIREYRAACAADGGRLWGRSLCGRLVLVAPRSRFAVAAERPPTGEFREGEAGVWIGRLPDGVMLANTSVDWGGRGWAMVLLPLPQDQYLRVLLLLHESFHRIQDSLGLREPDRSNPQLDERDGRYLLRLELNAMAAALESTGPAGRRATRDAALFRRYRQQLYPGSDTLENALELAEGLPEYTGARLALDYLHLPVARAARLLRDFQGRATYVRALGYGTGPGLGLLLDRYAPGWRTRVRRDGIAAQLATAVGFRPPADLAAAVQAAAPRYGGDSLALLEDARARERAMALADYRQRLVDGPVLDLRQEGLARAFNPNTLVAFGDRGTVYPTGSFASTWGELDVDSGGALVAPDFKRLRVPAPSDTSGAVIHGAGWTLKLAQGWHLAPGDRPGDLVVVQH